MTRRKPAVAVVTGASSGIGRATALEFARRGVHPVLVARSGDRLREVAKECAALGTQALAAPADVTQLAALQRVTEDCLRRFGRLDVWVNNAVAAAYGDFGQTPLDDFRRVIEVALFGYVHGAAVALPHFRRQRRGVLINVASVLGVLGIPHMASYVAAKHAIVGLSEGLRQELYGTGVEVCLVLPGTVDTEFYAHAANHTGRVVRPVPPALEPEDVARRIVEVAFRPRKQTFIPASGAAIAAARVLLPNTTERLARAVIDRFQVSDEPAPETSGNLYEPSGREPGRNGSILRTTGVAALIGAGLAAVLLGRQRAPKGVRAAA